MVEQNQPPRLKDTRNSKPGDIAGACRYRSQPGERDSGYLARSGRSDESNCGWEVTMISLSVGFRRLDAHQAKIDGELAAVVDLVLRDSLNDG